MTENVNFMIKMLTLQWKSYFAFYSENSNWFWLVIAGVILHVIKSIKGGGGGPSQLSHEHLLDDWTHKKKTKGK